MDGWCGEGFEENKGTGTGCLEKVFRTGQDPQRVVEPIIIIIIIIIITRLRIFVAFSSLFRQMPG
jgi:hypothetical protein